VIRRHFVTMRAHHGTFPLQMCRMTILRTGPPHLLTTPRKKDGAAPVAATVAAIARRQHGTVTRRQLLAAGLTDATIARWVRAGRLHRLHRGVYAVGHVALSREGKWMAAVLAVGDGAVLGGACAAHLWRISRTSPRRPSVVVARDLPARRAFDVQSTRCLPECDVTVRDGIRVLTVSRLLVDLADEYSVHRLVGLMREARYRRVLDLNRVLECAGRLRNRRGHATLLRAVELHLRGRQGSRSLLELRWLALLDAAGVAEPEVGVIIDPGDRGDPIEVDNRWCGTRLVVEVDGGDHLSSDIRRKDDERDRRLVAAGWRVIRVTEVDIERDPDAAVRRVRDALGD
jgi:hypothetical protein